jgi:hypothetical protein
VNPLDRLIDLILRRATEGLTAAEDDEMIALQARFPDVNADEIELTVAALDPALREAHPAPPLGVLTKLNRLAVQYARGDLPPEPPRAEPAAPRAGRAPAWLGWAVAAGVSIAFASYALWPKPVAPAEPTLAQLRDEFVSRAKPVAFAGANDAKASASVQWSTAEQTGFLEVRGLAPNDPAREQYQLWIVDPAQEQPIDGGVFDVKPDGTALVRMRPPIRVSGAKVLAITKEKAGGVVVTKGPHVVVLTPKA